MANTGRSEIMASLLEELGWSISRFAAEVNVFMSSNTGSVKVKLVPRSTVQDWIDKNRLPHEPFPSVITQVFTDALGREITTQDLWADRARPDPLWVSASQGLDLPYSGRGTRTLIIDWLANGGTTMDFDRRLFGAVSGGVLTGPAWDYVDHLGEKSCSYPELGSSGGKKITTSIVTAIEGTIRQLRSVDDEEGGADHTLAYVHQHFSVVADYLKNANLPSDKITTRLLSAWAQLCQLAGWMAYDANKHGLAQRYFITGLHAAHSAKDRHMGAHILACMTYHALYRNRIADAINLSNAASEAAEGTHPSVRSLVSSRFAYVQAALGNTRAFYTAKEEAYELIESSTEVGGCPEYLYWYNKPELDVQVGHSLLTLAETSTRNPKRTLQEASALMGHKVNECNEDFARDALYHVAWLARSFATLGDYDRALEAGWKGLHRLGRVASPRSLEIMHQLDETLRKQNFLKGAQRFKEFHERYKYSLVS